MKNYNLLKCLIIGTVFMAPFSLSAQFLPTAIINDLGLITPLTGNIITEGLLSAGFDQGLPVVVGLLSDNSLISPIVEQGVPFFLQTVEPVLVLPYSIPEFGDSLNGIVLPGF